MFYPRKMWNVNNFFKYWDLDSDDDRAEIQYQLFNNTLLIMKCFKIY